MPTAQRIVIIAFALGGMAATGLDLWSKSQPAERYARAVARGYARPIGATDPEAAEDEAISQGANEAGYRWAEQQGLTDPRACPAKPAAFHDGCVDWTAEQAAP